MINQRYLAIDTSSSVASICLATDGGCISRQELSSHVHAPIILSMVDAVMMEAKCSWSQLDGLLWACGPGAFTGLRVASAVVQGFHFAHGLPVFAVSTLLAYAQWACQLTGSDCVQVVLDARMGQLYAGLFQRNDDCWQLLNVCLQDVDDFRCSADHSGVLCGNAVGLLSESALLPQWQVDKTSLLDLANYLPSLLGQPLVERNCLTPTYIRNRVVGH